MSPAAAYYLTDDLLLQEGPGVLYGFSYNCSANGGTLTIYDGLNAQSGRLLFTLPGWQYDANTQCFANGILFETGLYVVLDANVANATIIFEPKRSYTTLNLEALVTQLAELINQPGG
jgi:hypothetical protein